MNLLGIIEEIDKADPEFQDRISPRRDAIKNITGFGSKVAIAALPLMFTTLLKKAYGQTLSTSTIATLNFALKLEYLEAAFYNAGAASTVIQAQLSATEKAYLTSIQAHENAHVKFLQSVLGSNAVAQSTQGNNGSYDFTAGGTFPTALTQSATYLSIACAFEDTGVRAYKGAAPSLIGQQVYLTAALDIHSVEARHASAIRQLLYARGLSIKPWITGANDTGIAAVNANYAGEDNTTQGGVNVTTLPAVSGSTSTTAATEAFDEPLDATTVAGLVAPFGVK